jgi:hypothetical protein
MPDPNKYTNKQDWMDACMHHLRRNEGKKQEESVAQCVGMWATKGKKKKKKKSAALFIRDMVKKVILKESSDSVIYTGIFFNPSDPGLSPEKAGDYLERPIKDPHVTFSFRPDPGKLFPEDMIGKEVSIKVVGVGNDGRNHGYEVEVPPELKEYYDGAPTPHITISTSLEGKPVDTKNLDFKRIPPLNLKGKIGHFTSSGVVGV